MKCPSLIAVAQSLLLSLFVLCALPLTAQQRQPIPTDAAQAEAMKLVKEVYGSEYDQAVSTKQKQALANKLFQDVDASTDPANRFALLRVTKDIAIQAGDADLAMRAVNKMAAQYQFRADESAQLEIVYQAKLSTLAQAAKTVKSPEQHKAMVRYALNNQRHAAGGDRFSVAAKFAEIALAAARKCGDRELARQVVAQNKEIRELGEAYAEVEKANSTLEKLPTDPAANLAVGGYRCFVKGDWDAGLPMLALGNDADLKKLAVMELGESPDALALGDAWWDLEKESGAKERAAHWYRRALPGLTGLVKEKIEKRLGSLKQVVDLIPLISVRRDAIRGSWRSTGGGVLCPLVANEQKNRGLQQRPMLQVPFRVPGSYTLSMTVERKEGAECLLVGLPVCGKHILVGVDISHNSNRCSGIEGVDGASFFNNSFSHIHRTPVIPMGKPISVSFVCGPEALAIQLDGRTIVDWRGNVSRLPEHPSFVVSEPHIIIGSYKASFEFRDIQLKFTAQK